MSGEKTENKRSGNLYVVSTPIGNLEDITLRALRILGEVTAIACEDTRQTIKILNQYNLRKKLISYYHPREKQKIPRIISLLKEGRDVALVSDAGTPGLSDPGYPLIREALKEGINIIPIPGASALTTALAASGLPTHRILFFGFAPTKKEATKKLLHSLKDEKATLIFYLPPRKAVFFLKLVREVLGNRKAVIAREMTKIYEEFLRGKVDELIERWEEEKERGEATVLIEGSQSK
jgi:16S rRNA (cytidine1402-2'-O)-methyltransferase